MRLSELRKKKKQYFTSRKRRETSIDRSFGTKKAIRYYIEKVYQGIPEKQRKYISEEYDVQRAIDTIVNSIMYMGGQKINPYIAFTSIIKNEKKKGYRGTKEELYKEFRTQESGLYAKYNSYVYRMGESAVNWFIEKGEVSVKGSTIIIDVEMPDKYSGRVFYDGLHLEYDWSGGYFTSAYMY